jgi:hypothetical protein
VTEAYFIDSLDARGGLAFASYRSADLSKGDADVDLPSVFIGPPMFRPERVASRAVAFAASRGSFQFGLYVGEAEVAFPTLEDVIEFVRRAYLRGGSGDGAGGIGPGVPQIPGGAPEGETFPDFDPEVLGGESALSGMLNDAQIALKEAHSLSNKFQFGEPFETSQFQKTFQNYPPGRGHTQALALGAMEIILALVHRFPAKGSNEELLKWLASANRLGQAIAKTGLWRPLLDKPWSALLNDAGFKLSQRMTLPVQERLDRVFDVIRKFGDGAHLIMFLLTRSSNFQFYRGYGLEEFIYQFRLRGWFPFITWDGQQTDPVDDLATWPLSQSTAGFTGTGDRNRASAYDLLSAVLGSPDVLAKGNSVAALRAAALVVLAATHITTTANPVVFGPISDDLAEAASSDGVQIALDWLVEQFPTRIFPAQVEALIEGASALRYA